MAAERTVETSDGIPVLNIPKVVICRGNEDGTYSEGVPLGVLIENESIDVFLQDQTSEDISLFLGEQLDADVKINANTTINQEVIELSFPNQPPLQGDFLCIKEGDNFSQSEIIQVAGVGGDNYSCSIAIPLDYAFTTGANVCLQNCDMNVNGSSNEVEFYISPEGLNADIEWDITRMIISMTHASSGDDGKFGGITALSFGVYFRVENGVFKNLFNAKENSDFANEGYDIDYKTRSGGGGDNATRARITFSGQDKRGVVKRLSSDTGDKFLARVRDDLSGLTRFRVKIQGHVVD